MTPFRRLNHPCRLQHKGTNGVVATPTLVRDYREPWTRCWTDANGCSVACCSSWLVFRPALPWETSWLLIHHLITTLWEVKLQINEVVVGEVPPPVMSSVVQKREVTTVPTSVISCMTLLLATTTPVSSFKRTVTVSTSSSTTSSS